MKLILAPSQMAILTTILSGIGGYADAAGFLRLKSLFIAHVTGNLVVAGAEITGQERGIIWIRLVLIPVFVAAIVLTTIITQTRRPPFFKMLWFEAGCFLFFTAMGLWLLPNSSIEVQPSTMLLLGAIGAFTMGVQNVLVRQFLGNSAQTTAMTGNLTQLTIDLTQKILFAQPQPNQNIVLDEQIMKFGSAVFGFAVGAIMGALLMKLFGFWSILLLAIAVIILAIDIQKRENSLS